MKNVVFNTLPTVKMSGEIVVGNTKTWLSLGVEGVECPSGIIIPVEGTGDVTVEDVVTALSILMETVEEVVVAQIQLFAQKVRRDSIQL